MRLHIMRALMVSTLAALACALLFSAPPASAQTSVADFYRGKRIFLQIGSGPGGAYDVVGRLVARHIGKHIPGTPSVVAQNVPGGGSLLLANQFATTTKPDGLTFGVMNSGMPTSPLLNPTAAHFDPRKFAFLGSTSRETEILVVWNTAPVKVLDDIFAKPLILGASAPGSATYDIPYLMNALLGTKFKIIPGYQTAAAIKLAMERGEIEGNAALGLNTAKTQFTDVLDSGKLRIIGQYGARKNPELANVPLIPTPKSDADRQIMDIALARADYGQPFVTPPGVPPERVTALRTAFAATMSDPDFLAEAKQMHFDINPVSAEDLHALTERLYQTPPDVLARARALMMSKGSKK
ncbi:MAG TPA: tripartite tricarboxylate transporter substrate-binding protein [Xanthobacteraceae bacterium]|jgi:tripartite-type tricarboxylate transporter receptor subunit TctC|nr:tripartite tricarboxylate transporter substrate-binding protein [Xanthobacteraceae bacterium]